MKTDRQDRQTEIERERERDKEGERETKRERERQREREKDMTDKRSRHTRETDKLERKNYP